MLGPRTFLFEPMNFTEKKFICFSTQSDMQSKDYDFFDDVVFHIKPYLESNEISVIEIGQSNI